MKLLLSFLFCLFSLLSWGQTNLCPNPSFEQFSSCPNDIGYMYLVDDWSTFGESSDFFHTCATVWWADVPSNGLGYQYPASGNAYCGLIAYYTTFFPVYREFIGTQLVTPLTIGVKYFVSFQASMAYNPIVAGTGWASNNIGALFTMNTYDSLSGAPINNFAHVYTSTVITDTTNWTRIFGSFVADSVYPYVAIGNFFDDANTDTLNLCNCSAAYYYIDDVCISTDSLFCQEFVGISEGNSYTPDIDIYPNPFSISATVSIPGDWNITDNAFALIYDNAGRVVRTLRINNHKLNIEKEGLPQGIYLLQIITIEKSATKKFIITE